MCMYKIFSLFGCGNDFRSKGQRFHLHEVPSHEHHWAIALNTHDFRLTAAMMEE